MGAFKNIFNIEFILKCKRFKRAFFYLLRYGTFKKSINFLLVEYERGLGKTIVSGKPYFLKVDVANICDAGCKTCTRNELDYKPGSVRLEDFKKIIDKSKDYVYMSALHFLGEPLMNENIFKMIEYAHKNKVATYLSSNLQHFREEDAQALINSGLDLLTVSIDGATEKTYKLYRKNGQLKKVLNNIKIIVQEKNKSKKIFPEINLQFIVMEHNEHEIAAVKVIAKSLGVDSLEFKPLGTLDKTLLPKNQDYRRRVYQQRKLKKSRCWWLWAALVVLYDGSVVPCCMVKDFKICGNLIKDDITNIKNTEEMRQLRHSAGSAQADEQIFCKDCVIPYGNFIYQTI